MPHIPVMVSEVTSYLLWDYSGIYVDCTVGDGMHSRAILGIISSRGGSIVALDRDKRALSTAKMNLKDFGSGAVIKRSRFSEISDNISHDDGQLYSGFLFDLGLNNSRLEEFSSGFSYLVDVPLDMRMTENDDLTAKQIVNNWPERALADLIFHNSDERHSRKIARAIVKYRAKCPIETTFQLKDIIFSVVRGHYRLKSVARCFQALRIAVNDEIEELKKGLASAFELLLDHGRMVVISYHSIEDRIVKQFFRECRLRKKAGCDRYINVLTAKPLRPSQEECQANRAARSAKLRAAEVVVVSNG